MTEDEMVGWHHQLNGHEFEQTPGDSEGQRSPLLSIRNGIKSASKGGRRLRAWPSHRALTCQPLDQRLLAALSSHNHVHDHRLLSRLISTSQPVDQHLSASFFFICLL